MSLNSIKRRRLTVFTLAAVVVAGLQLTLGIAPVWAEASAQTRKRPQRGSNSSPQTSKPKRTSPADTQLTPRERYDRARSAETQNERIELLDRFLASSQDSRLEAEARELLMREYALRGEQYLREANPKLAMKDFRSVLRIVPLSVSDRIFSQFVFPLPLAMNAFGYRDESVELMRSFESRFDADPNRVIQIGFFYVQIEAPLEAVRVLERAVKLAPDDHRAHNGLGNAYLIALRLNDAAAEFARAVEINPKDEFANLNLANLARASGNHEAAVDYYRKHLSVKPDDAAAIGGMSISLLALGRDEEATPAIQRAMQAAPENYQFLVQLAYFYVARKKAAAARSLVERAAAIEPRYAWTAITKANVDSLEAKHGDALATLISAQQLGGFATLKFELVKAFMSLDGYDQAIEVMGQAFRLTPEDEFEGTLGGVVKARSPRIDLLLERERHASLQLHENPTTAMQYRLAEALFKIDHYIKMAASARRAAEAATSKSRSRSGSGRSRAAAQDPALQGATRPRRAVEISSANEELTAGSDSGIDGVAELIRAIDTFTTLDDGRQIFRMVWVSRKLTDSGIALSAAEQLAQRVIEGADAATEPDGSMRDTPLLDRKGRRAVLLGRAYDALGWALFKRGNTRLAIDDLTKAVEFYPPSAERKNALWHLAVATEESGDDQRALDFYIESYQPETPIASARRAQIETLYKKLNGSLAGLEEKLKVQ
jgi:tetratricopeptide (TPR) repeat protein